MSDANALYAAARDVTAFANDGLEQIHALAVVALELMETRPAYAAPELLAMMFKCIRDISDDRLDLIATAAETGGFGLVDEAKIRRHEAQMEARDVRAQAVVGAAAVMPFGPSKAANPPSAPRASGEPSHG